MKLEEWWVLKLVFLLADYCAVTLVRKVCSRHWAASGVEHHFQTCWPRIDKLWVVEIWGHHFSIHLSHLITCLEWSLKQQGKNHGLTCPDSRWSFRWSMLPSGVLGQTIDYCRGWYDSMNHHLWMQYIYIYICLYHLCLSLILMPSISRFCLWDVQAISAGGIILGVEMSHSDACEILHPLGLGNYKTLENKGIITGSLPSTNCWFHSDVGWSTFA